MSRKITRFRYLSEEIDIDFEEMEKNRKKTNFEIKKMKKLFSYLCVCGGGGGEIRILGGFGWELAL